MKNKKTSYYVRGGTKQGAYITEASQSWTARTGRKYAWSNKKSNRAILGYDAARKVAQRYNGEIVAE